MGCTAVLIVQLYYKRILLKKAHRSHWSQIPLHVQNETFLRAANTLLKICCGEVALQVVPESD